MWLQRCVLTLRGALPGAGNGIASLRDATKGSYNADSQKWRSNDALREYLASGVDETRVTVQSSTHDFHVSKRLKLLNTKDLHFLQSGTVLPPGVTRTKAFKL